MTTNVVNQSPTEGSEIAAARAARSGATAGIERDTTSQTGRRNSVSGGSRPVPEGMTPSPHPPTPIIDDWGKWMMSNESAELINKQHQEELFKSFDASASKEECSRRFLDNQEIVFLFKGNFGDMPLNMFHHVKASGGTIHEPTVKIGFIQGIDRELTSVQMPDMEALCNQPVGNDVPIPTFANIYSVTNEAEIDNLNNGATTTYKPRTFIPVTPFYARMVVR